MLTIISKNSKYRAVLRDTENGVEVKIMHCLHTDGREPIQKHVYTTILDFPFHIVADRIYDVLYELTPQHTGFGVHHW
jgi:hypothetical protein